MSEQWKTFRVRITLYSNNVDFILKLPTLSLDFDSRVCARTIALGHSPRVHHQTIIHLPYEEKEVRGKEEQVRRLLDEAVLLLVAIVNVLLGMGRVERVEALLGHQMGRETGKSKEKYFCCGASKKSILAVARLKKSILAVGVAHLYDSTDFLPSFCQVCQSVPKTHLQYNSQIFDC